MRLMVEAAPAVVPADRVDRAEATVRLHLCDVCPHMVVSAADIGGRPCRACAPWGRLELAGVCSVDVTPPQ